MLINNESYRTIWFDKKKEEVKIIDQTKLPFYLEIVSLNNLEDVINAINLMQVRGAPLIGATAAYGVYLAYRNLKDKNKIISYASNSMVKNHDPTSHAEIVAIRKACKKLKTTKLLNFSIYTTLEPCLMCESLIISVGIKKIYFGAFSDNVKIHKRKMKN